LNGFFNQCDPIIIGANRPNVNFAIGLTWTIINVVLSYLLVVVFKVAYTGLYGIMFILLFKDMILLTIFGTVKYIYIHKKIVPIKFPWWQALGATFFACLISFGVEYFLTMTLYKYLYAHYGFIVAVFPMFVIYLICGIVLYFAMNAFFGGYDKENLEYLHKCVKMAGPSTFLVKFIYKITNNISQKSPFFNKFPIPWEQARIETEQLYQLKMKQKFTSSP
jgi:hypothetical protein